MDNVDPFTEAVVVQVEPIRATLNADQASDLLIKRLRDDSLPAVLVSRQDIEIAGKPAVKFIIHPDSGRKKYIAVTYVVVNKMRIFVAQGATLSSRLDQYENLFDDIAHSLKFLD